MARIGFCDNVHVQQVHGWIIELHVANNVMQFFTNKWLNRSMHECWFESAVNTYTQDTTTSWSRSTLLFMNKSLVRQLIDTTVMTAANLNLGQKIWSRCEHYLWVCKTPCTHCKLNYNLLVQRLQINTLAVDVLCIYRLQKVHVQCST